MNLSCTKETIIISSHSGIIFFLQNIILRFRFKIVIINIQYNLYLQGNLKSQNQISDQ